MFIVKEYSELQVLRELQVEYYGQLTQVEYDRIEELEKKQLLNQSLFNVR